MVSPTPPLFRALRRLKLTTKQAGKDYYKGNRTGSMGRHTKYGTYIIDYDKVRTFEVPDLTGFMLTPFVTARIKPEMERLPGTKSVRKPMSGLDYLEKWKGENGES